MAYCGQDPAAYFNFSNAAAAPEKLVVCSYLDGGVGMPAVVLSLFVFGTVGMALTYRVRHPGPIVVAGLLTGGVAASTLPGPALSILALVILVAIAAMGMYLYQRSKDTL